MVRAKWEGPFLTVAPSNQSFGRHVFLEHLRAASGLDTGGGVNETDAVPALRALAATAPHVLVGGSHSKALPLGEGLLCEHLEGEQARRAARGAAVGGWEEGVHEPEELLCECFSPGVTAPLGASRPQTLSACLSGES